MFKIEQTKQGNYEASLYCDHCKLAITKAHPGVALYPLREWRYPVKTVHWSCRMQFTEVLQGRHQVEIAMKSLADYVAELTNIVNQ